MPSDISIKICGLTRPEDVAAACNAGARYVAFNFFAPSPRSVDVATAAELGADVPAGVAKIALVVNGDDAMLDALVADVPLDMIQLHGSETPERVRAIKARYGLPVMKAVGVATSEDLPALETYAQVADQTCLARHCLKFCTVA